MKRFQGWNPFLLAEDRDSAARMYEHAGPRVEDLARRLRFLAMHERGRVLLLFSTSEALKADAKREAHRRALDGGEAERVVRPR